MMSKHQVPYLVLFFILFLVSCSSNQQHDLKEIQFPKSEDDIKPWVYWFLTDASISERGISKELEAMKENGIGGAFLFTVRGAAEPSLFEPAIVQLTPEWWDIMTFAVSEADRLGIKLGIHACDGFTAAGGPWITPELSMQKVVWTDTLVSGGKQIIASLPQPEKAENYYEDIATFAYPALLGSGVSSYKIIPEVTTSIGGRDASFLAVKGNTLNFTSRDKCWIQYRFDVPFTCRSITLQSGWNNYQANRLILETSNDGLDFKSYGRLDEYRHGWDDRGVTVTHLIEPVRAKYFRFVFDPDESEPGAEDLDDAKWRSRLSVSGIELSGQAKIHHYEGKSGAVWRISKSSNREYLPETACVDPAKIIEVTEFMDEKGHLAWDVPPGEWTILRMGHTSTGSTNYIGGGGVGLEADKLNPEAVKVQFENWFDSLYTHMGVLAESTIEELYNDSWECGSQNWSPVFADEFKKRRGYDIKSFLPVMAGVPIKNDKFSEQVLHDIRTTIAEVLVDNYHGTMKNLAHEKGCCYSSESVAPVFVSDGMLHFKNTDAPTGEFWFRSPSHDKPNDVLDAISGAHIYGKNLVRAEAGTEIRLDWDEHPALFKTLFDRNFALGINKMIFHVITHDPWTDRIPGKTLGVVGTFFQPNQTWWKSGKAWVNYIENCQVLLQKGIPVTDIAVFTGEEIPRRAVLPDRLVPVLPGIFGEEKVQAEKIRLENKDQAYHQLPKGVTIQKNLADPMEWIDPLGGYAYDSFNKDALINLASVKDGKVVLPSGASYSLLIIPGKRRMNPESGMSFEVAQKLLSLVQDGAMIYFQEKPVNYLGADEDEEAFGIILDELFSRENTSNITDNLYSRKIGKGQVLTGTFDLSSFESLKIPKDFYARDNAVQAEQLAWNHRADGVEDIYFIANQLANQRHLELSFRVKGKLPVFYFPVNGEKRTVANWYVEKDRTIIPFQFEPNESVFVLFEEQTDLQRVSEGSNNPACTSEIISDGMWQVQFDPKLGGPEHPVEFEQLTDWSKNQNKKIKYYSGTAVYRKNFNWQGSTEKVYLDMDGVCNVAEVVVNGKNCGIAWTAPYRVDVSESLIKGTNQLEIALTNTWANRLMGDNELPEEQRITWTTCDYRLDGEELLPAGLLGPVRIMVEK